MNVAFVGCGGMAAHYLGVYRDLDWVEALCCIDSDVESARRAAASFGDQRPVASADFELALAPEVDAVIINTPNFWHARHAVAAIEAGKHMLMQKPVAAVLP